MANAAKLRGTLSYRGMHMGLPGSGKTGAIAALADAGYKIRVLDFGGNPQSLIGYSSDKALENIDIVVCQDRFKNGDKYIETVGIPEAFNLANRMLKEWKYEEDGQEVNLGKSAEWGPDTVLVVDDGTGLAKAILRRAIKMNNKTRSNMTSAVWGHAVADYNDFIGLLTDERNKYHVIINVHQQMIGPSDFLAQGDDSAVKEKKLEAISHNLIPTRWYPVAVTKPQAQTVHGQTPILLHFEKVEKLGKLQRVIETEGDAQIDVKIPIKGLRKSYPIETGLAEIFKAAGYKEPGL